MIWPSGKIGAAPSIPPPCPYRLIPPQPPPFLLLNHRQVRSQSLISQRLGSLQQRRQEELHAPLKRPPAPQGAFSFVTGAFHLDPTDLSAVREDGERTLATIRLSDTARPATAPTNMATAFDPHAARLEGDEKSSLADYMLLGGRSTTGLKGMSSATAASQAGGGRGREGDVAFATSAVSSPVYSTLAGSLLVATPGGLHWPVGDLPHWDTKGQLSIGSRWGGAGRRGVSRASSISKGFTVLPTRTRVNEGGGRGANVGGVVFLQGKGCGAVTIGGGGASMYQLKATPAYADADGAATTPDMTVSTSSSSKAVAAAAAAAVSSSSRRMLTLSPAVTAAVTFPSHAARKSTYQMASASTSSLPNAVHVDLLGRVIPLDTPLAASAAAAAAGQEALL